LGNLAVEYKGADRWSDDDSKEKRTLGELWAKRSGGTCLFVMPKGKDLAEVWKGTLDEELKWVVTDLLEAVRRSIREYRIRGAEGLRKELALCVGTLVQNHALFKAHEDKEEVSRFGRIISKLNAIVTFALKLKELGIDLKSIAGFIGNDNS